MNLLITTRCNKGCSFCFAQKTNQINNDMSFENFKRILDFIQRSKPTPYFKLLGGEPTMHPQFIQFLEEVENRKLAAALISNGLYKDPAIRASIKQAIKKENIRSILFNAAELTPQLLEVFSVNYLDILPLAKETDFALSCGITLHQDLSVEKELEYISQLISKLEIHHLRISLDFPGDGKFTDTFINNFDYGRKILGIVNLCNQHNIVISGDCILYPCLFEDKFFVRKKLRHFIEQVNFVCEKNAMPFDVYPDLSYFHCYPAQKFGGKNLLDFPNYQAALTDMAIRKQALTSIQKTPEACQACSYFKKNECAGLCLGCNLPESILTKTLS